MWEYPRIICEILSVPQNIVIDLNNFILPPKGKKGEGKEKEKLGMSPNICSYNMTIISQ